MSFYITHVTIVGLQNIVGLDFVIGSMQQRVYEELHRMQRINKRLQKENKANHFGTLVCLCDFEA